MAVQLAAYPAQAGAFDILANAFEAEHSKVFGYVPQGDALQFVALKAVCSGITETPRMPAQVRRGNEPHVTSTERKVFYGEELGWLATPVIARADIGSDARQGSADNRRI